MPKALVLGVDGQDGSYLAEFLLARGYQVIGWVPAKFSVSLENIRPFQESIILIKGDLGDQDSINNCLVEYQPDEIYNLASPSSPFASWGNPAQVGNIAGLGVARLLQAIQQFCPVARFYQASSSELFGDPVEVPQNELTPFCPRNPYGIAKLYGHWMTVRYRRQFNLHTSAGILFNHESPRRGPDFVTRKITRTAAQIKLGLVKELCLGSLDARRDWGFAGDYVEAMWLMLQQDASADYVIGTGITHSVREFCELAFGYLDLDYRDYVIQDAALVRSTEASQLMADASKARKELGWEPKLKFEQLVHMMVSVDLSHLQSMKDRSGCG